MHQEILLGDEAVARGAIDAGLSAAYAYPGTPATEIYETIDAYAKANRLPVRRLWSTNEKVALEEGVGVSYSGKRALVSMKHVGLNVAADPFMNVAVAGDHGGLVLAVADDPSMHSSQNEQDSRYFADFAQVPCLEPSNQQECYEFTRQAFDLSETVGLPVLLRLVTRLAHSRAAVTLGERRAENEASPCPDPGLYTLIPVNARRAYARLLEKQEALREWSEDHAANASACPPRTVRASSSAAWPSTTWPRRWGRGWPSTTSCASAPIRCPSARSGGSSKGRARCGSSRRATRSSSAM
jgi:indolepyruvate ferredoxin oxidoreductase, alpha subunit